MSFLYSSGAKINNQIVTAKFWQSAVVNLQWYLKSNIMGQKKETAPAVVEKGVISSMERIISASKYEKKGSRGGNETFYKYSESFIESIGPDASYLSAQYHITPRQAVLFTIIMSIGKGDSVRLSTLFDTTELSLLETLNVKADLKALEAAMLIRNDCCDRYIIPHEVNDLLLKNMPYVKPLATNLSTANIMTKLGRLFKQLDNDEGNSIIYMHQIDNMILSNPNTSIAKAADKHGILKAGSQMQYYYDGGVQYSLDYFGSLLPMERMLFYALCYRYDRKEDDCVCWSDVSDFFEDNVIDYLSDQYREENLEMQFKGILEYANVNGVKTKDYFKIADSVKEEIFADCGGLHEATPMTGTILNRDIVSKELFYDDDISRQVNTLSQLLSEERFGQIRSALTAKGMRSGFTCLFYGSPGTGKTETVYQLARNAGRDIIMVDVSKLKSCWVGESEKNFKALFSRYRQSVKDSKVTPILLFNEADAIFGIRRSGAESAVDKMENSLQNILLQEMEDLQGILIATTNLTENLDKAFERRFLYKIKFSKPSAAVKCQIWKSMIPGLSDSDASMLSSKYEFSGGQIENIVRKKAIQSILTGTDPSMDDIINYCSEEVLGSEGTKKVVGFK